MTARPAMLPKHLAARGSGQSLHLMPSTGVHTTKLAPTLVSDPNALSQSVMPCLRLQWHGTAAAPVARIVQHDKERWHGDAWFASSPSARGAAGRGHRRGLDGRVDAKSPYKSPTPSPANVVRIPATAGHADSGDSSQRSIRRRSPQGDGGHERGRVPRVPVPNPARTANCESPSPSATRFEKARPLTSRRRRTRQLRRTRRRRR